MVLECRLKARRQLNRRGRCLRALLDRNLHVVQLGQASNSAQPTEVKLEFELIRCIFAWNVRIVDCSESLGQIGENRLGDVLPLRAHAFDLFDKQCAIFLGLCAHDTNEGDVVIVKGTQLEVLLSDAENLLQQTEHHLSLVPIRELMIGTIQCPKVIGDPSRWLLQLDLGELIDVDSLNQWILIVF